MTSMTSLTWHLTEKFETPDGYVRWASFGEGQGERGGGG